MTQLPPDDRQWKEFLRQHRPVPPPAAPELEERLMQAIEKSPIHRRLWAVPPALAAGLLMAWSGYRTMIPLPAASNSATLEAFLENNWNSVVGDTLPNSHTSITPDDWMVLANSGSGR